MYIYLYIDVAMCLMAIVEMLRITLVIIENVKDTSLSKSNRLN
jgi:hypothetical protein